VGAPKSGTTSLYRYLSQHPQIYLSPVKEPNYFSSEVRPARFSAEYRERAEQGVERVRRYFAQPTPAGPNPEGIVADWQTYLRLFQKANEAQAIGEASVCYLWSETAAANIGATIPGAKIIMILRDPVERAFSQYLHNARDGVVRDSFRGQIERAARNTQHEFQPLYPFLENGLYYQQVKRYLDVFPREEVRIFLYEDAWQDSARLLRDIFEFLGVDPAFPVDLKARELAQRAPRSMRVNYLLQRSGIGARLRRAVPAPVRARVRSLLFKRSGSVTMNPEDREYLLDYYREDVRKLAGLLGLDLQSWLK
jgi:Sulfotransferase family